MSSGTPTPNLKLMQLKSTDDIVYDEINQSLTRIDSLLPMLSCTSTTRPTTDLYNGKLIYETDTGVVRRYEQSNNTWPTVSDTTNGVQITQSSTTIAGFPKIGAYQNNFVSANGAGDDPVIMRRNGVCQLIGRVRQTAGFTGGVAFNIPNGFRPPITVPATVQSAVNGGNAPGPSLIVASISAAGDLSINRNNNSTSPVWDANTWITLALTWLANSM